MERLCFWMENEEEKNQRHSGHRCMQLSWCWRGLWFCSIARERKNATIAITTIASSCERFFRNSQQWNDNNRVNDKNSPCSWAVVRCYFELQFKTDEWICSNVNNNVKDAHIYRFVSQKWNNMCKTSTGTTCRGLHLWHNSNSSHQFSGFIFLSLSLSPQWNVKHFPTSTIPIVSAFPRRYCTRTLMMTESVNAKRMNRRRRINLYL